MIETKNKSNDIIDMDAEISNYQLAPQKLVDDDKSESKYARKVRVRRKLGRGAPPFPVVGMENRDPKAIANSRDMQPPFRKPTTFELVRQWGDYPARRRGWEFPRAHQA